MHNVILFNAILFCTILCDHYLNNPKYTVPNIVTYACSTDTPNAFWFDINRNPLNIGPRNTSA